MDARRPAEHSRPSPPPNRAEVGRLFDKLPPHAIEAEMSLLGSMLLAGCGNIHIIGDVMQIVRAEDFYLPKHVVLYDAMTGIYDRQVAIDIVQLAQRLKDSGQYDAIGKEDYLVELAESVPTAVNAHHYARIVADKATLRRLVDVAGETLRDAFSSSEPAAKIVDTAERRMFEIAHRSEVTEASSMAELMQDAMERLEASAQGHGRCGVPTGFHEVDELLNGLQRGEMIVLAARPSMGKTALALNFAEGIAMDNRQPVAVFSLEMGKTQLADRLLTSRSGIDGQKMRRNQMTDAEIAAIHEAAVAMSSAPLYVDETASLSITQLRAKARRMVAQRGVVAIIVDYLQLMTCDGSENRTQEVSAISRGIKSLARELDVPVVVLSQLNRNPEGRLSKRPMLSDLRESGAIEQDADVVMMLHREEYYHQDDRKWIDDHAAEIGVAELIVAKQRNGPTGTVRLAFDRGTTRFRAAAPAYLQDHM